jgi:cyanophycinase-like exopeptidase
MASTMYNYGVAWQSIRGISADEATAFALDVNGVGKVFGTNSVHFVKATNSPEVLAPGSALTWSRGGQALQVYQVQGTANGANTFDVGAWTGSGGVVHYWSVNNGSMTIN